MKMIIRAVMILSFGLSSLAYANQNLVGKTFTHSWTINTFPAGSPVPAYVTIICDYETLVWNNVTDPKHVTSGVESYLVRAIDKDIVQVSWKESPETTNYGMVWTLNFRTNEIFGVLVNVDKKTNYSVAGKFQIKQGTAAAKPLTGCP
jgi:hypothetical protein